MTYEQQLLQCTMYRGHGEQVVVSTVPELLDTEAAHVPVADRAPIRGIMSRDLVCASRDLEVGAVISLMVGHRIGCLPVIDERQHPVGVITKFDLVEQLDAAMRAAAQGDPLPTDLKARTADDVMMPIALSLDEHATVAHAAAMMKAEETHHVLVVDSSGVLIGVVSSKDIVRWVVDHDTVAVRGDSRSGPPRWHPLEG